MATVLDQTHCDRCEAPLQEGAAYCDSCGERTRKARRLVRLAVRVELLFLALVVALVIGFALVFSLQH
jgi:predicted nucleic acid-binding Zn ribbon protein